METVIFTISEGFIIFDGGLETIKVPNFYYEDETNIYQLKEMIRCQIKSLPNDCLLEIKKNISGRIISCKDDDIITIEDKLIVHIITQKNNVPNELKTGLSLDERSKINFYIQEFYEDIRKIEENLLNTVKNAFDEFHSSIKKMADVFNLESVNDEGYEGDLVNGLPNGYGRRFRHRKFSCDGTEISYCTLYEGMWKDGYFHGIGIFTSFDSEDQSKVESRYEGNFVMGKRDGYGILFTFTDGTLRGEFKDGFIIGYAEMEYLNGDIYQGGWDMECRQGIGKMIYSDGTILNSEWEDDVEKI